MCIKIEFSALRGPLVRAAGSVQARCRDVLSELGMVPLGKETGPLSVRAIKDLSALNNELHSHRRVRSNILSENLLWSTQDVEKIA